MRGMVAKKADLGGFLKSLFGDMKPIHPRFRLALVVDTALYSQADAR